MLKSNARRPDFQSHIKSHTGRTRRPTANATSADTLFQNSTHRKSGSRQPAPIPLRFSHALYSELCARAAELRIMLRMHNDGQVLLIFIECRAQLFEVDAELGVEKGPEEAQLFY